MEYRYHNQPGCGGCLLLALLLILVTGGLPMLFEVLGALFFSFVVLVLLLVLISGIVGNMKHIVMTILEASQ